MTWEIVLGLIALGGALIAIGKIIANNTRAMTELRCAVDMLNRSFEQQQKDIGSIKQTLSSMQIDVEDLKRKVKDS